jgi:hypothetical protein
MRDLMLRFAILASLVSATAAAEPPGLTQPAVEEGAPSYRAQLILSDVVGTTLLIGGVGHALSYGEPSQPAFALGLATYGFGGPIIHLLHHHPQRAVVSFAMRIAAPLVTAGIGSQLRTCFVTSSADCNISDAAASHAEIGALLGAIGAMAVDTAWLGAAEPARPAPSWQPTVGASRSGITLGLAGTF